MPSHTSPTNTDIANTQKILKGMMIIHAHQKSQDKIIKEIVKYLRTKVKKMSKKNLSHLKLGKVPPQKLNKPKSSMVTNSDLDKTLQILIAMKKLKKLNEQKKTDLQKEKLMAKINKLRATNLQHIV